MDIPVRRGRFKNCWYVEKRFDTAMPSNSIAIQARRAVTSSAGAVRPRIAGIQSLERPERPTQSWGEHGRFLIVSTLRAFVSSVDTIPGPNDPSI